uniref:C-type lectin domain-containing protein n=1 Tax=Clytia hemisphaerica TaxID=252671 RepID=A0A7M5XKQ6_9CNID
QFGNSTYVFVTFKKAFNKAKKKCGDIGADLVIINSKEEFEYINSQMGMNTIATYNYWVQYTKPNLTSHWHPSNSFEIPVCDFAPHKDDYKSMVGEFYGLINQLYTCMDPVTQSGKTHPLVCEKQIIPSSQ